MPHLLLCLFILRQRVYLWGDFWMSTYHKRNRNKFMGDCVAILCSERAAWNILRIKTGWSLASKENTLPSKPRNFVPWYLWLASCSELLPAACTDCKDDEQSLIVPIYSPVEIYCKVDEQSQLVDFRRLIDDFSERCSARSRIETGQNKKQEWIALSFRLFGE